MKRTEQQLLATRKWRSANPDKVRAYSRAYRAAHPEEHLAHARLYRKRRKNDAAYLVSRSVRNRVHRVLGFALAGRSIDTMGLLGCSSEYFLSHLERLFQPGMTFENYGVSGWHIDHIRPCATFDLTDEEERKACFHYSNLQPLWATDNYSKGSQWLIRSE